MKWNVLVEFERRKNTRIKVKDSATRGLGLISLILVAYLGLAESVGSSPLWNQVDKGMHFTLFAVFTFTFLQYARFKILTRVVTWLRLLIIFTGLFLIGFVGEIIHLVIPNRTFDWWDMAANFAGIFVVGFPILCIAPFRKNQNQFTPFDPQAALQESENNSLRIRRKKGR